MNEAQKEWLIDSLQTDTVTVKFLKKDGTERVMKCTLSESFIPDELSPKNSDRVKSNDTVAVFDVEKQAWRSFRWDSILTVSAGD